MFSVYGKAGQIFRGSLEELGKVAGIRRTARSRRIEALGLDAQDHSPLRFADVLSAPRMRPRPPTLHTGPPWQPTARSANLRRPANP